MLRIHVVLEIDFHAEGLRTQHTRERLLLAVFPLHVNSHVRSTLEPLPALHTRVRTLPRVRAFVARHVGAVVERHPAVRARERAGARVDVAVELEPRQVIETLSADFTRVLFRVRLWSASRFPSDAGCLCHFSFVIFAARLLVIRLVLFLSF